MMLSRLLQLLGIVCATPLVVMSLFITFAALGGVVPAPDNRVAQPSSGTTQPVFLVFTPIHTDFALPLNDAVRIRFDFLNNAGINLANPGIKYLIIGWGSRAFYTSTQSYADVGLGPTWKALTGDKPVMHIQPWGDVYGMEGTIRLELNKDQFDALLHYILASFKSRDGRHLIVPDATFGFGDVFFEANGKFNLVNSCNIWASKGLRKAGFRSGLWTPTTFSLKLAHHLHN